MLAFVALAGALAVALSACGSKAGEATKPLPAANLWVVAGGGCNQVTRMNAAGKLIAKINVGCELRAVSAGAGGIWFSTDKGSVVRVDPDSNRVVATIPVGTHTGAIVAGSTGVWVSALDTDEVVRIDPASNAVVARIPVGSTAAPVVRLAANDTAVWALQDFKLAAVKIDPTTNKVTGSAPLCPAGECRVGDLAVGNGRTWAVNCCAGEVSEIDPATLAVRTNARLGRAVWYLAGSSDQVWALNHDTGQLARLEPNGEKPASEIETGAKPASSFTFGAGSLWFYDGATSEILRVSTDQGSIAARIKAAGVTALAVSG